MSRPVAVLLFIVGCLPRAEAAQLQQGTIYGTTVDVDGQTVDSAVVTLLDALGNPIKSVTAQAGRFQLTNVAPG